MRGGTHFGEAGEALFGAYADTTTPNHPTTGAVQTSGPRGVYRGWSSVFQGFVVDDDDDSASIFTTEQAARAWATGE